LIVFAQPKDIKKVFGWRNSPEIVALGTLNKTVIWDEHVKWFNATLEDNDKRLLIVGDDAGAVRLERTNYQAEISIYIVKYHRGEGLGKQAIKEATALAFQTWDIDEVVAYVKEDNHLSLKAFTDCGYQVEIDERQDRVNHVRLWI
jgi:RimJ/RimL family protein N-acetyltransferase